MSSHCYLTNFILKSYDAYYKTPLEIFHQNSNVTSQSDELLRHVAFYVTVCTPIVFAVLTCYLVYFLHDILFTPFNRVRLLEENGYQQSNLSPRDHAKITRKRRRVGEKLPPVYPNGWFQLIDSLFVKKGEVKEVCALGEHFAVYRTHKNKVHVLDAYCPHMGSNLAVGGLVKGDCLQCPFHGWTFDGESGECVKIPYTDKIPKTARTRSWQCKEVNGGIFVWYHCDGEAPSWDFPKIEEIHGGKFSYKGRVEHHTNTHIQDIPENGSDLAHLSFLHKPNVMSGVDLSKTQDNFWNIVQHIFTVDPVGSSEEEPHVSKFFLRHYLLLLNKIEFLDLRFTVYQIGPGIVHLHFTSSIGEGVFVQTLTPVEPLHQVLVHRLYTNWKIPMFAGKIMLALEAIQVDRDVMVWNNKTFVQNPMLVRQEKLISQFRRWYSQFYSANSPTLKSLQEGNDTLDW